MSRDAVSRRIPLQDRSRARAQRILDTAAALFVSLGYDATTTEQIAAQAGTSIGSIYQFFPNKRAMFDAIAARHLAEASQLFEQFVGVDFAETPWRDLLERTIDAYGAYHRQNLGFRAILLNWKLSPEFLEAGELLNQEFARRAEAIFASYCSDLPRLQLAAASRIVVEVVSTMLVISVRMDEEEAARIFDETKTLLVRYLTPYLGGAKRAKKTSP